MGQVLHRSATTTEAVRRVIQHSQESMRALAGRHGINQKTVAMRRATHPFLPTASSVASKSQLTAACPARACTQRLSGTPQNALQSGPVRDLRPGLACPCGASVQEVVA